MDIRNDLRRVRQSPRRHRSARPPARSRPLRLESLEERTLLTGPADFVYVQQGELPIVLLAPHGGSLAIPNVNPRTTGNRTQDARTLELTVELEARLTELLGARPYVVAALFHRRFIDANRPAGPEAYEDPRAAPYYAAYHDTARAFVTEVRQSYPCGGILLDVHGQGSAPATVYRGTRNGTTVRQLLNWHGPDALVGPASVLGGLGEWGYTVFPTTPPPVPPEQSGYAGGHTVNTYGSHRANGIDAIQLEIGSSFRLNAAARAQFVEALAWSVVTFYASYLNCRAPLAPGGPGARPPAATRESGISQDGALVSALLARAGVAPTALPVPETWQGGGDDAATRIADMTSGAGVPLLDATTAFSNGGGNDLFDGDDRDFVFTRVDVDIFIDPEEGETVVLI